MPFESLQYDGPGNMKHMTPEVTPVRRAPFDPLRDLREQDWQNIEARYRHIESGGEDSTNIWCPRWKRLVVHAADMCVLGRHITVADADPTPLCERMGEFKEAMRQDEIVLMQMQFLDCARSLRLMGMQPVVTQKDRQELDTFFADKREGVLQGVDIKSFPFIAQNMKILDATVTISAKEEEYIRGVLEEKRANNEWIFFAGVAAALRLLGRDPQLTRDDWQRMLAMLDTIREPEKRQHWQFTSFARQLAVLGAEKAAINNGRILLTTSTSHVTSPPGPPPAILHFMASL